MTPHYVELRQVVTRVRSRWRLLTIARAWSLGAATSAGTLLLALATYYITAPQGRELVALWSTAAVGALIPLAWSLASYRHVPGIARVARYIEERCPELDDTLATAIAEGAAPTSSAMLDAVVADALRRVRGLEADRIISRSGLRRAGVNAAAATAALCVIAGFSAAPGVRAAHLLSFYLFPETLGLEISPGNARLRAGQPLKIQARVSGALDGIAPVLRLTGGDRMREVAMERAAGVFAAGFDRVDQGFRYVVAVAGTASHEYQVTVVQPPRVQRIDLQFDYPATFGLAPRREEDAGDIYGPVGTRVRVSVHADRPVTRADLTLAGRDPIALSPRGEVLEGEITIAEDGSYRIALTDVDGIANPGDAEYFIRTLNDRPPEVRIVRPVGDKDVTPLEEVSVEARADDDFGISGLDLVYSVRGAAERVVPFVRDGDSTAVTGQRTLYVEDLHVQPGDFVTYYARARDVSRGKRSTEARSDIFFLEVKPFDAEFVAASSQANSGGGDSQSVEGLIAAQKDVISATWKLDRRARDTGGRSADDIRTIARAQGDLRSRAEAVANQVRRMSEPNRGRFGRSGRAGATAPPDDSMARAVEAMGQARQHLESLETTTALPYEMTALNELLRADAEVRRREIQRQQANGSGGRGDNRQQQDLSAMFDRELARQQQTNYETPPARESNASEPEQDDALERIRELGRRQDALTREQQTLAKSRRSLSDEEFRRQLERLTRDESELRRQTEDLARQVQGRQRQGSQGTKSASGARSAEQARSLREASEQMANASSELRRQNPGQASANGTRASERLREVERRMNAARPGAQQRNVGELQLESQQLAGEERRLASETPAPGLGSAREDAARRRAAQQERLADRMRGLEQAVRELAKTGGSADGAQREALAEAAREVERQHLSERMREAARAERENSVSSLALAGQPKTGAGGAVEGGGRNSEPRADSHQRAAAKAEQEIAKDIDRLGARLGSASQQDEAARRLADRLARVRELRDRLDEVNRELQELSYNGGQRDQTDARLQDQPGSQTSQQRKGQGQPQVSSEQAPNALTGGRGATAWQQAMELLQALQQEQGARIRPSDVQGFQPGLSAPGTEGWKQDFAKWEDLKTQLATALERAETTTAGQLRAQQSKDRLNAGTTQAVPGKYRELVDRYYRALAAKPQERR